MPKTTLEKIKHSNLPVSEAVKIAAANYIQALFGDRELPPRQEIELKLAFYAGMIENFGTQTEIAHLWGDDECCKTSSSDCNQED